MRRALRRNRNSRLPLYYARKYYLCQVIAIFRGDAPQRLDLPGSFKTSFQGGYTWGEGVFAQGQGPGSMVPYIKFQKFSGHPHFGCVGYSNTKESTMKKGTPNRHIIMSFRLGNRRWELHATKGWRGYRIW